MGQLKVRNWDKWQSTRKGVNMNWIKVHRRVLMDPDFIMLSDAEKWHLVGIWMVAADRNGIVNDDPKVLKRVLNLDEEPDLEKFLSLQLLEKTGKRRRKKNVEITPECRPKNALEKRREETPVVPLPGDKFEQFWRAYPNPKSRGRAEKAFAKLDMTAELFAEILAAIEFAKTQPGWKKDGGQFIPHPATWLNGQCWKDRPANTVVPFTHDLTPEEIAMAETA